MYIYCFNGGSSLQISYPTPSGRKIGYIRHDALFSVSYPTGRIRATKNITVYTSSGREVYGEIYQGDICWVCGVQRNGYTAIIYPAKSGQRAGKLGYYKGEINPPQNGSNSSSSQSSSSSVSGYNRSQAVAYARAHALDTPEISGSDCANFVSKCLEAGGLSVRGYQRSESGFSGSSSYYVPALVARLREIPGVQFYRGVNLSVMAPGDVIVYNWGGGQNLGLDHVSIVTSVTNNNYTICSHTKPHKNDIEPNDWSKVQYTVHFN